MRHMSATQKSLRGVGLCYVNEYVGHANYETIFVYDRWVKEISKFHTGFGQATTHACLSSAVCE